MRDESGSGRRRQQEEEHSMSGGHADIIRRASDQRRRSDADRREPLNMLDAIDVISKISPAQRDKVRMLASPNATVTVGGSPRDRRRRSRSPSPLRQYSNDKNDLDYKYESGDLARNERSRRRD
ncbi:hypothetical protein LTR37_013806 [Vermiconidia calcicola]|uniref:Uncharacterized protein n=1 Tax=Vermiconidia calcicola TaxID=1690605 RepID=A0ACC3MWM5_9PEZI|nr:hypothetical protein LTR37_013806 [Vermiconidia calcicola]